MIKAKVSVEFVIEVKPAENNFDAKLHPEYIRGAIESYLPAGRDELSGKIVESLDELLCDAEVMEGDAMFLVEVANG